MAEPRGSSIDGKLAEEFAAPSHVDEVKEKMSAFARRHADAGRRVVLITSGGTKVPLESRTVRFLDNFSSGRRGASSAEYFIDSGYAVIFLHRHRSLYPYTRMFLPVNLLEALQFRGGEGASGNTGEVVVNQQLLPNVGKVLKRYNEVKEGGLLLPIEFNTLSEYLHLLKAAAQELSSIGAEQQLPAERRLVFDPQRHLKLFPFVLGSLAMFYLAAAVSDFYIPASEMPEHKIQSSNGPLQVSEI